MWVLNEIEYNFEIKKRLLVTMVAEVNASFFGGGGASHNYANGFDTPLSTTRSLMGQAAMKCLGLSRHMHLLMPTWCLEVVLLVLP